MKRVLRVPGLRLLLAGQAINATGNWVALIAIWGFAAFRFDAGAADIALLFVALSVPGAILGPLLGVPIDRLGPRRTLILANLVGLVNAVALTQADSYTAIIVLALPLGLIEAMATASLDALPPRLVGDEDLVAANALLGGAQDLAIVVGPAVAAFVNVRWGLVGAFLTDAATFAVGAAVAWPLKTGTGRVEAPEERPDAPSQSAQSTWADLRAGLTLARRTAGLRWTLSVAASVYALWALFGILEPLYVRDVLGESDTVFALLQSVFGLGLVATSLVLAAVGERVARPRYVASALVVSGFTAALYVGTQSLVVAFVGVALWGVDVAFFYVPTRTLLQRYAPMAFHGRILSINQSLEPLAEVVTAPVAAALVVGVGVQLLGVIGGGVAIAVGIVALRRSRHLSPPPPPGPVDLTAGSSRDAVALGGSAPG